MRIRSVLAAGAAVLATALLTGATLSAADAATPATATKATYSQPLWFPLHDSQAAMDCAWSNPGCPVSHRHADHAEAAGAKALPQPIPSIMAAASKLMKTVAYRI